MKFQARLKSLRNLLLNPYYNLDLKKLHLNPNKNRTQKNMFIRELSLMKRVHPPPKKNSGRIINSMKKCLSLKKIERSPRDLHNRLKLHLSLLQLFILFIPIIKYLLPIFFNLMIIKIWGSFKQIKTIIISLNFQHNTIFLLNIYIILNCLFILIIGIKIERISL